MGDSLSTAWNKATNNMRCLVLIGSFLACSNALDAGYGVPLAPVVHSLPLPAPIAPAPLQLVHNAPLIHSAPHPVLHSVPFLLLPPFPWHQPLSQPLHLLQLQFRLLPQLPFPWLPQFLLLPLLSLLQANSMLRMSLDNSALDTRTSTLPRLKLRMLLE